MIIVKAPFNINIDFWANNFNLSIVEPFDEIYKLKDSSKIMWCIWMLEDPNDLNPVFKIPEEQKESALKKYYKHYDSKDTLILKGRKEYSKLLLTNAAKAFKEEEGLMQDRSDMMKNISDQLKSQLKDNPAIILNKDYQAGLKTLDTMRKTSKSIYDSYTQIRIDFNLEQSKVQIEGGGTEGFLEAGNLPKLDEDD